MIIKIMAIPQTTEDGQNVLVDGKGKTLYEKERAFVTTKDGRYQRVVSLTDELAAEVAKGNRYFNAIDKDGKLHITGAVAARF